MPQGEKGNRFFNWLAKGTRAEPWPTAKEVVESREFKNLQKIGKQLVQDSRKKAEKEK